LVVVLCVAMMVIRPGKKAKAGNPKSDKD